MNCPYVNESKQGHGDNVPIIEHSKPLPISRKGFGDGTRRKRIVSMELKKGLYL